MKVQLKKALKHKDQELTELDIPLEELTGADLIDIEKQVAEMDNKKAMLLPEFSKLYLATVAARAARIPVEALRTLSARDFTTVTNAVQIFLTGSDSETDEQPSQGTAANPESGPAASLKK